MKKNKLWGYKRYKTASETLLQKGAMTLSEGFFGLLKLHFWWPHFSTWEKAATTIIISYKCIGQQGFKDTSEQTL